MEKTQAILIGRSRYAESSLIIHWCSAELGLFRTLAKGALRPRSAFSGMLDLFVSADISYLPGRKSDLHTLAEAHWNHPRLGLRASYGRVLAATYLVKLIALVAEPHAPLPAIHDLLGRALDYLDTHDPSLAFLERFELRVAEDLGLVGPDGESSGSPGLAIAENFHRRLPVQRQQVLDWLQQRAK